MMRMSIRYNPHSGSRAMSRGLYVHFDLTMSDVGSASLSTFQFIYSSYEWHSLLLWTLRLLALQYNALFPSILDAASP